MAEKKEKPKLQTRWGQSQAAYLLNLRDKPVTVVMIDGKALKGTLTGVDTYEIFIRQDGGLEILIPKGAVKYLHPMTAKNSK